MQKTNSDFYFVTFPIILRQVEVSRKILALYWKTLSNKLVAHYHNYDTPKFIIKSRKIWKMK